MSNHARLPTNAKVSISLTLEQLEALDGMAASEGRSRSNMLQRIIDAQIMIARPSKLGGVREKPETSDHK